MKRNRIFALSAVIALAFAVIAPANAQFNSLVNKVKKAAKEKVDKTIRESKKKVENASSNVVVKTGGTSVVGTGASNGSSSEDSYNYEGPYGGIKELYTKGYMPSAEAKAADPNASITTVEKNYKKSPAQLRGVWEHLSKELFPYQPYYLDINKDYFDPDADASVIIYAKVCRLLEEADRPFGKKGLMAEFFQYKDDTNVPIVDVLLSSYYAEFFADPESYVAYNHFNRARVVEEAFNGDQIKLNMEDPQKFVAKMGDGTSINLFEKEFDRIARWRKVNEMAQDLAIEVTPLTTIGAAANNAIIRYKKHEENGNLEQMIITSRELQYIMKDLERREDYMKRKSDFTDLLRRYEPIEDGYRALLQARYDASAPAAEMPKGVTVSASLKSKADAEARKQWGTGFVKSIFLTSQWSSFKNPKYPYQVMHRSMDVDFIVKEGDNYFIYHWVLKEGVYGGKGTGAFSIMARMKQPTKENVNYK